MLGTIITIFVSLSPILAIATTAASISVVDIPRFSRYWPRVLGYGFLVFCLMLFLLHLYARKIPHETFTMAIPIFLISACVLVTAMNIAVCAGAMIRRRTSKRRMD